MTSLADPDHYQHTTRDTPRYRRGDLVTVLVVAEDEYILNFQRQVTDESRCDGGYMVRLESTSPDMAVQGPIPESRLLPGWVEQDGHTRRDVHGRRK